MENLVTVSYTILHKSYINYTGQGIKLLSDIHFQNNDKKYNSKDILHCKVPCTGSFQSKQERHKKRQLALFWLLSYFTDRFENMQHIKPVFSVLSLNMFSDYRNLFTQEKIPLQ